jgi:hypothetical protein
MTKCGSLVLSSSFVCARVRSVRESARVRESERERESEWENAIDRSIDMPFGKRGRAELSTRNQWNKESVYPFGKRRPERPDFDMMLHSKTTPSLSALCPLITDKNMINLLLGVKWNLKVYLRGQFRLT